MSENEPIEKKRRNIPPRGDRGEKISRRPFEVRLRAVKLYLEEGFSQELVTQELGISISCLNKWLRQYRAEGEEGLKNRHPDGSGRKLPTPVIEKILELKKEEPARGIKRISQILKRVFFLQASPETVRQTLKKQGLVESPPKPRRNLVRPRFFERATPNQMWQTDIFTFRLGGRYAYLIGFMDDYSRFLVGADLFRSQTAENVLEVFRVAMSEFNPPKEMLTDNGRQYTSWRGTSRFEAELKKNGIDHFKSRPHHPMTLGKIERFWETIWQEFLSRAQFESFESARDRIRFWIKYYNHKRPHQGIEGLCPADRYFEIASGLRKTMEAGIQENLLEMALRGQPKAPFYMVGRMEGQSVILRAEKGKLKLSIEDGNENKELEYDLKQTSAPAPHSLLGPGKGAGDPGSLDRTVPAKGCLQTNEDTGHDLLSVAAAGDGGNASSAGVEGEPGPGGCIESATAKSFASPDQTSQHAQAVSEAGANTACQTGGKPEENGVDDSLTKASQPDTSSSLGPDHGPAGSAGTGDLPAGVLQMGETRPQSDTQRRGGPTERTAQNGEGPGQGTVAEPGAGTGTTGAPL
jgi:transposase InsO family protein